MTGYVKNWLKLRRDQVDTLQHKWPHTSSEAIPGSLDPGNSVYRILFQAEADTRLTTTLRQSHD